MFSGWCCFIGSGNRRFALQLRYHLDVGACSLRCSQLGLGFDGQEERPNDTNGLVISLAAGSFDRAACRDYGMVQSFNAGDTKLWFSRVLGHFFNFLF